MTGARRDFTYFALGGAAARALDAILNGDPAGLFAALVSGAVVVGLVWLVTGWRVSVSRRSGSGGGRG